MTRTHVNATLLASVAVLSFVGGRLLTPAAVIAAPPEGQPTPEEMAWMKAMTPGEHHQHLSALVGKWAATVKFRMDPNQPWEESTGTVNREWVLDKRFVKETVEGTSAMGTFQGLGFVGYNNMDGVYQSVWMENMSTAILSDIGSYDPTSKTMTFRGTHRDPTTGSTIMVRSEINLRDNARHTMVGYATGPSGQEYKSFEGVFTRQ
jgi:hypothetical protein